MLLDLFFLLVVQDVEGRVVEIVVTQEVLEHAQEVSISEYGVDLQELLAEVVIEILEESKVLTGGDYEIVAVGQEPSVALAQGAHVQAVVVLTGSVSAVVEGVDMLINQVEPSIVLEFLGSNSETATADVIDRD